MQDKGERVHTYSRLYSNESGEGNDLWTMGCVCLGEEEEEGRMGPRQGDDESEKSEFSFKDVILWYQHLGGN